MPELNVIHITIISVLTVVGLAIGWVVRGKRALAEKAIVKAGWQEQINAQRMEHDRLTEQNKTLMEQVSQYLASNKDLKDRAKDLSEAGAAANKQRVQLQSELMVLRRSLEISIKERDQLRLDIDAKAALLQNAEEKDARIEKLKAALENWQGRLPPLLEKFQKKTEEADRLEQELAEARERLIALEELQELDQTLIEAVRDPEELTDGRSASNDAVDDGKTAIMPNARGEFEFEELISPEDVLGPNDDRYAIDEVGDGDDYEDEYEVASEFEDAVEVEDLGQEDDPDEDEVEVEVEDLGQEDDPDEDEVEVDVEDLSQEGDPDEDEVEVEVEVEDLDQEDEYEDESAIIFDDTRDDLKAIKGVGPAIEKTLNELGIRRFQHIADMSEYDIDRVAKHLKGFRSRIYRENWIGQAQDLGDQDSDD